MSPNAVGGAGRREQRRSRPVGSKVNQPGQPWTATGVTGPIAEAEQAPDEDAQVRDGVPAEEAAPVRVSAKW